MTKKERIAALEAQVAAMRHEINLLKGIIAQKQDKPTVYFGRPQLPNSPFVPQIPDKWLTCGSVG